MPNPTAQELLERAGLIKFGATPSWYRELAEQLTKYVQQGSMTQDEALVELRTQVEGRRVGTGGLYQEPSPQEATGGAGISDMSQLEKILTPIFGAENARTFIASDPAGALKTASSIMNGTFGSSGGSGGGGTGRTVFPWEQQNAELGNQMTQAQLDAINNPSSRFTNVNGFMVDRLTGQTIDPTDLGVSRFNADTQRKLADFTTGARFAEDQRQFDVTAGTNALQQQSTSRLQAAQGESVLGNLGIDRAKFITDVFSRPADGLARLYSQRGGVSPTQQISMADIINSFNQQTSAIGASTNANLAQLGAGRLAGLPGVPIKPPIQPTLQANLYPDYASTDPNEPGGITNPNSDTYQNDGWYNTPESQQALMSQDVNPGGSYGIQEQLEMLQAEADGRRAFGGHTRESRFIVGDQRSGKPTGNEELIVNPTNAPIMVVPNKMLPKVSRFNKGTVKNDRSKLYDTGIGDDNPLWNLVYLLDELKNKGKVPRYDEGTGGYAMAPKKVNVAPTGGFLNSLKEAIGMGPDEQAQSRLAGADIRAGNAPVSDDPAQYFGAAGIDDVSRMFTRASMGSKLARAQKEGLSTSHFEPEEMLRTAYQAANDRMVDLTRKYSTASRSNSPKASEIFKEMSAARKEAMTLSEELETLRKATREQPRQAIMDQVSDAWDELKTVRKMADEAVERESGGAFKTAEEIIEALQAPNLPADRARAIAKLGEHPAVLQYEQSMQRYNSLAGQSTRLGGSKGVTEIEPGISTEDSIRQAVDPEYDRMVNLVKGFSPSGRKKPTPEELQSLLQALKDSSNPSGYAQGTVSRFAEGSLFEGAMQALPQPYDFNRYMSASNSSSSLPTANTSTYDLGYGGDTTQEELIGLSRQAAGPGGNSVLSGQMPSSFRIPGLPTPTARQFNSLSADEREALKPRLAAEFNTTLEDLMFNIEQRYGTNNSRMARFRG